jgi:predicted AAA+ superfamily ATPase
VTHDTARRWVSILEASYIVTLLRPHHESFSKRLVKTPKLYFVDTGVLCALLGIRVRGDLALHPLRGAIFESFVISELRKQFLHHGERAPVWFWRDRAGHEVDVLIDLGVRRVPLEAKSGETVAGDAFRGLDYYARLAGISGGTLVYGGEASYRRGPHAIRAWFALT